MIDPRQRFPRLTSFVLDVAASQSEQRLSLVAAGGAFWMVIAVFPASLAVISLFGLVLGPDQVAARLTEFFGSNFGATGTFVVDQMTKMAEGTPGSLTLKLVVSVLLAVWSVGAATYNLSRALRAAYDLQPQKYLVARILGFIAAFVMILVLGLLVLTLTTFGAIVSSLPDLIGVVMWLVGIPLSVILLTIVLVGIHAFSVGRGASLGTLVPGCLLASVALMSLNFGLRYYLVLFPPKTAMYGALAGVVVFMLLSWIAVYVVLLAGTINARIVRGSHVTPL